MYGRVSSHTNIFLWENKTHPIFISEHTPFILKISTGSLLKFFQTIIQVHFNHRDFNDQTESNLSFEWCLFWISHRCNCTYQMYYYIIYLLPIGNNVRMLTFKRFKCLATCKFLSNIHFSKCFSFSLQKIKIRFAVCCCWSPSARQKLSFWVDLSGNILSPHLVLLVQVFHPSLE